MILARCLIISAILLSLSNRAIAQNTASLPTAEDKRAAAGMVVTLSGFVMTAALAVLAGQVTFAAFFFDKGKFSILSKFQRATFVSLNLFAVLLLVGSIVVGGRGIAILYKQGFRGQWELAPSAAQFGLQSVGCLAGLVIVLLAIGIGIPGSHRAEDRLPKSDELYLQRVEDWFRRVTLCIEDLNRHLGKK